MAPNATGTLASHAVSLSWDRLPTDVQDIVRQALFDAICCGIAGSETDLATIYRKALDLPSPKQAHLLGVPFQTTAPAAAFHNALAVNALDYDDTGGSGGHPGSVVIPAALAAAELAGAGGVELLTAIAVGYEVTLRVGAAIRPSPGLYTLVHSASTHSVFGAAAAAGRLLGLDERGMCRAFGIAGPWSPVPHAGKFGWGESTLSWIKDNVALPAEAGVRAAMLAVAGLPASETVLDGEMGFWRMAASDQCNFEILLDRETFHLRDLGFKTYPCCRWLHPALDALAETGHERVFVGDDVAEIIIETTEPVARLFDIRCPRSMIDAQFSAPHAFAMALLQIPHDRWWRQEWRQNEDVQRLMETVRLVEVSDLNERFLELGRNSHRVPARVAVRLKDGTVLKASCEHASGASGRRRLGGGVTAPNDPMLARKYRTLLEGRLSADAHRFLVAAIESPEGPPLAGQMLGGLLKRQDTADPPNGKTLLLR